MQLLGVLWVPDLRVQQSPTCVKSEDVGGGEEWTIIILYEFNPLKQLFKCDDVFTKQQAGMEGDWRTKTVTEVTRHCRFRIRKAEISSEVDCRPVAHHTEYTVLVTSTFSECSLSA
ncbi:hypothetical protein J6590_037798 [Homalodisca vitripennis]|nr:hypothetical protein J6590_037798 [Homalodisca vitripennis]